jgi:hypothetical protein
MRIDATLWQLNPGYENLLGVMRDPTHEEHEERLQWLGGRFEPETPPGRPCKRRA